LFTPESQQQSSLENAVSLRKEADESILTCLLNSQEEILELTECEDYMLKRGSNDLIELFKSKSDFKTIKMYADCHIRSNFELKLKISEILGNSLCDSSNINDIQFTGKLYAFLCEENNETGYTVSRFFLIASYLYNVENDGKKETLLSFMTLVENIMSNARATYNCKVKLLLEVLALIEKNIDCENALCRLSKVFSESPIDNIDGMPGIAHDNELVEVFREHRLTLAQNNVPVIIQPKVVTPKVIAETSFNGKDQLPSRAQMASTLVQNQENMEDFSGSVSLSIEPHQVTSSDQCVKIKQDLDNKVINRLLNQQPRLKELSKQTDFTGREAKRLINELRSGNDITAKLQSVPTSSDFEFLFIDEMMDMSFPIEECYVPGAACIRGDSQFKAQEKSTDLDAKFSSSLFFFHCLGKETPIISSIALYLYKKADSKHAPVVIEFLKLAINVIDSSHATTKCKINLLIGVANLVENNIDCIKQLQDMSSLLKENFMPVDGPAYEEDDLYLIRLFKPYSLIASQHNIKIVFNAEENKQSIASNIVRETVVQQETQAELYLPSEIQKLNQNIVSIIQDKTKVQKIDDDIQNIIDKTIKRKGLNLSDINSKSLEEDSRFFLEQSGSDIFPPEEVYQSKTFLKECFTKEVPKGIGLDGLRTWNNNEAKFLEMLFMYNYKNKGSEIHQIVSVIILDLFHKFDSRNIEPLTDFLVLANDAESMDSTQQEKLNMLVTTAILIQNEEYYKNRDKNITSSNLVLNSENSNDVLQVNRQVDQAMAQYTFNRGIVSQPTD
jgi:hypothetical protein